jgi:hypothetical protein
MPEIVVVLMVAVLWVVPVAAAAWALFTLHRIRTGQDALRLKLETLERLLQQTHRS